MPLLVAFVSLGLPVAGAPPESPSTPAGQVLAGYLEAMNSGAEDKLEAFVKAHRPDRPDALDRMLDLRWNTGGLDLYSIESSEARNVQAVLHQREGAGAPGMDAILRVYPRSGEAVIVLCNFDNPSASRMADWLHTRMPIRFSTSANSSRPF